MKAYVMRHGYAGEAPLQRTKADDARDLDDDGVEAADAIGKWMKANGEIPSTIIASPIRRAEHTAELMSEVLKVPFVTDPNLEIGKPVEMVLKKLADDGVKRPLIIAHEDNLRPGLARMNYVPKEEVDPFAMTELRALKVDRKEHTWKEKFRVLPSDVDAVDYY